MSSDSSYCWICRSAASDDGLSGAVLALSVMSFSFARIPSFARIFSLTNSRSFCIRSCWIPSNSPPSLSSWDITNLTMESSITDFFYLIASDGERVRCLRYQFPFAVVVYVVRHRYAEQLENDDALGRQSASDAKKRIASSGDTSAVYLSSMRISSYNRWMAPFSVSEKSSSVAARQIPRSGKRLFCIALSSPKYIGSAPV